MAADILKGRYARNVFQCVPLADIRADLREPLIDLLDTFGWLDDSRREAIRQREQCQQDARTLKQERDHWRARFEACEAALKRSIEEHTEALTQLRALKQGNQGDDNG